VNEETLANLGAVEPNKKKINEASERTFKG
jgi:hypothetical protein